jgi:hypothetical protein
MGEDNGKMRLKPGPTSVFVGRSGERDMVPSSFRLDVRDDGGGPFFAKRQRPGFGRKRRKLMHYISAGGMGQMRRTTADDIQEMRQSRFLVVLGLLAVLWLLLYFAPLP